MKIASVDEVMDFVSITMALFLPLDVVRKDYCLFLKEKQIVVEQFEVFFLQSELLNLI